MDKEHLETLRADQPAVPIDTVSTDWKEVGGANSPVAMAMEVRTSVMLMGETFNMFTVPGNEAPRFNYCYREVQ